MKANHFEIDGKNKIPLLLLLNLLTRALDINFQDSQYSPCQRSAVRFHDFIRICLQGIGFLET